MPKIKQIKEPKFMQELHKIRAQIAKEWKKIPSREIIASINESGKWLKEQLSSRSDRSEKV